MKRIRVCIITGYGINADRELAEAFQCVGGLPQRIHVHELIKEPRQLQRYAVAAFPGGFSFGDHLGSGKVLASLFKKYLKPSLSSFIKDGKLIIGICNGFQTLVKMGILPNLKGDWQQEVSLIHNDSGIFEDRWVKLSFDPLSPCVWTRGIDTLEVPVRHGEGKLITRDTQILEMLLQQHLGVCFYQGPHGNPTGYPYNPNGSVWDLAGICDPSGQVFGLMPHPEAFLIPEHHPAWTRQKRITSLGLLLFEQGLRYVKKNL